MSEDSVKGKDDFEQQLLAFAQSRQASLIREAGRTSCPNDDVLAALATGTVSEVEESHLRRHILACPHCAQRLSELQTTGLPAGQEHPSDDLLLFYLNSAIPSGPLGNQLQAQLTQHLAKCSRCRNRVQTLAFEVLSWNEQRQHTESQARMLQNLAVGISTLAKLHQAAAVWGAVRRGKQAKGEKRSAGERVQALVLDEQGKLMLDQDSHPWQVDFTVLEATLEPERGLLVELMSTDERLRGRSMEIQIALKNAGRYLRFAPRPLRTSVAHTPYPAAVATVRQRLAISVPPLCQDRCRPFLGVFV